MTTTRPFHSLDGQTVLVVGGSSGIGLGVAAAALESSAHVIIAGRSPEKLGNAVRTLGAGGSVRGIAADMTREPDVVRLFEEVGVFDHLVSTAGAAPPNDPVERVDLDGARRFIDNKLVGAISLAKHAVPRLRSGGSITFTSGINKDRPPVSGGAVVTAIAGSFGFLAHALALELAPTRVNVVSPGWVDTPMWDELVGPAKSGYLAAMAERLPARKVATPGDVARAYLYLMGSPFTTGETIHIDGGQRLI
jgi:NAD(P)-dependent dehydrogenase (short-subunit alcohol dehydrogenase family)